MTAVTWFTKSPEQFVKTNSDKIYQLNWGKNGQTCLKKTSQEGDELLLMVQNSQTTTWDGAKPL